LGNFNKSLIFSTLETTTHAWTNHHRRKLSWLILRVRLDGGTYSYTALYPLSEDWHTLGVEWQASSAAGANDGTATLWIDGVAVETLSGLDTDTYQLGRFKLGAWSMASTTTGTLNLDNFHLSQSTPTPTPTATATPTGPQTYRYVYDGDGALVLRIAGEVRVYSPGKHYDKEVSGSVTTVKKYYSLNGQTVAVRTVQGNVDILNWILADHLGSANVTAAEDGSKLAELRYSAFGEIRFSSGTTPTDYQYTGQLNVSTIQLSWYNSRWYDSELGHFIQPDTIIPNLINPSSWNRYLYVLGNPIIYTDSSGCKNIIADDVNGNPIVDNNQSNAKSTNTQFNFNYKSSKTRENSPYYDSDSLRTLDRDKLNQSGEKVWEAYIWLSNNEGWWNDYGNIEMSPEMMLGLWILFESSGNRDSALMNNYLDAAGNALFMKRSIWIVGEKRSLCTGNVCANGIFNHIGNQSGGAICDRWPIYTTAIMPKPTTSHQYGQAMNEPFAYEAVAIGAQVIANKAIYASHSSHPWDYSVTWGNFNQAGIFSEGGEIVKFRNYTDDDIFIWP
jgi:RHS repeat-associated protein